MGNSKQKRIVRVAKMVSAALILGVGLCFVHEVLCCNVSPGLRDKLSDVSRDLFVLAIIGFFSWASWRSFRKDADRPLPKDFDSDGGIDWQEKSVVGQVFAHSGSLVLLVPNAAVFEADEICRQLKEAGVRFKLENLGQIHKVSFSRFGRGGLTVRMRIWVNAADFEKAKSIADKIVKITA